MIVPGRRDAGRRAIAAVAVVLPAAALLVAVTAVRADATTLPTVIQRKVIGYSVQHRPITAYRLGDPTSHIKAVVLGQMHGDEPAGISVTRSIIHGKPIRGIDLWVILTMNPDGNAAHHRGNAHGVDLNRNWPDHWAPLTGQFYSGPRALSEPETRAMYSFLSSIKPGLMVSLHQPLDGVDTTDGGARNPAFARRLATRIGLPLKPFRCNSVCLGSMTGWLTNHQRGSAVTVEFPAHPSSSWLTSKTPPAIISSLGGAYDSTTRHNPILHIDHAAATGSTVRISGWTFDIDNRGWPLRMSVSEGSTRIAQFVAQRSRPDINRKYHLQHGHGFSVAFTATNGRHTYCIAAANTGYGNASTRICRTISVNGDPAGHFDSATTQAGTVTLTGWAFDRDNTTTSSSVQVRETGTVIGTFLADRSRPDVNAAHHIHGSHGFAITFNAAAGVHTYTVYAVNLGSTKAHAFVSLGAKTVTVTG